MYGITSVRYYLYHYQVLPVSGITRAEITTLVCNVCVFQELLVTSGGLPQHRLLQVL